MQVSVLSRAKRLGLAVAIAAFAYQPAIQASTQNTLETVTLPSPTAPMVDTPMIETLASAITTTKQLSQGAPFVGSSGHPTTGNAQIVEDNGQRYLEFDSAFSSDDGPDLFVLLHSDAVPDSYSSEEYVNLGRLQATEGRQRYAIPADVDISQLQSAVIWCQQFNVTFGYATLS